MRTLILCGGKGTRAYPHTLEVPKPLMQVGESPILLHIMEIYARQGFDRLRPRRRLPSRPDRRVRRRPARGLGRRGGSTPGRTPAPPVASPVCAGVLGPHLHGHLRRRPRLGRPGGPARLPPDPTRGRDGDRPSPCPRPTAPWSGTSPAGCGASWRNPAGRPLDQRRLLRARGAGFDHWEGDDLEREVLPALAAAGELYVYRHLGFWRSMDTYKDALELSALCAKEMARGRTCRDPSPRHRSNRLHRLASHPAPRRRREPRSTP